MKYVDSKKTEIKSSRSLLSFQTTGGGSWKVWDRYLAIDGKKAYHIGNICGTCNFFFERLNGANQKVSPKVIIEALSNGRITIDSAEYVEIEKLFPVGKYVVLSLSIHPRYVQLGTPDDYFMTEDIQTWGVDSFWGLPHYPKTHYYRETDLVVDDRRRIYIFVIPMVPQNWLDEETLRSYEQKFNRDTIPTAIAISHLDIKEPADWREGQKHTQHICFANYLLDGHHKIAISAKLGKPVNLMTFLSLENSIAEADKIESFEMEIKSVT